MILLVKNNMLLVLYFVISILYVYYRLFFDIDELLFFRSFALILIFLNYTFKVKKVDFLFLVVLLLEFIAGYVFLLNDNGFIQGLTIFLIINLLFTVIITKRIGVIEVEDVAKIISIFGVVLFLVRYVLVGYTKLLESSNFLNILEALSYLIGMFYLTKALLVDNRKKKLAFLKLSV